MAGITYLQVSAAAEKMVNEGEKPSIRSIQMRLGTGSSAKVQKLLKEWQSAQSQPIAKATTLSPALINAIISEISRCTADGKIEIEQKLLQAEVNCDDLATAVELLESERDELGQKLIGLQSECDQIAGKSSKQEIDLALLTERIEREQINAGNAQVALALEKLRLVDFERRDTEHLADIAHKSSALDSESKARIIAEQTSAVLSAKLENALAQISKADERIESLTKQMFDAASELKDVQHQSLTLQNELAARVREYQADLIQAQREVNTANHQLGRANSATSEAINAAKLAETEASELRGRINALQERLKDGPAAK